MTVDNAYRMLYTGALTVIGVCLLFVVIRTIASHHVSDKLMTVNMAGTMVTGCIAILAQLLPGEEYLADVCLIYVLISFLSTTVFTGVYINEHLGRKKRKDGEEQ